VIRIKEDKVATPSAVRTPREHSGSHDCIFVDLDKTNLTLGDCGSFGATLGVRRLRHYANILKAARHDEGRRRSRFGRVTAGGTARRLAARCAARLSLQLVSMLPI
jgi:hypothetical protein